VPIFCRQATEEALLGLAPAIKEAQPWAQRRAPLVEGVFD